MKIGILTYHQSHFNYVQKHNYGAVLQAFALKETIKNIAGVDCVEVIKYVPEIDDEKKYTHYLHRAKVANNLSLKIKTALFLILQFPKTFIRQKKVMSFVRYHLELSSKRYGTFVSNYDYDTFVLGSDQIWNKGILGSYDSVLWGDFEINKNARIISYAASGAVRELKEDDLIYIQSKLKRMHSISVREESFKNLLQPLTTKKILTTLDPTLLANPEIFYKITIKPKIKKKYVLVYSLSGVISKDIKFVSEYIAKKIGAEIHIITYLSDKWQPSKNIHETCSPQEFLGFFANAEYVLTNSFHGTAFSLIFKKQFLSFLSDQPKDERVLNILSKLELNNKAVYNSAQAIENWALKIKWDDVYTKLEKERASSLKYLQNSLID